MQRLVIAPRENWQKIVEGQGFFFHSVTKEGETCPYWDESAYYRFSAREIEQLERASYALNDLCLKAVEHVLTQNLLDAFRIAPEFHNYLRASWDRDEHTVYGRFDFTFDGQHPPKLLEYNADTPTALLEAAVVQWYWLKDQFPRLDQFNSIHERLLEIWKILAKETHDRWYFASLDDHVEDYMTVNYLRDVALQAGLDTEYIAVREIGWNQRLRMFVDKAERPMRHIFKLYPWEWMLQEAFGPHLLESGTGWMEAPWKMLLSNKAILPILYQLAPECPYLLRAAWEPFGGSYVKKPIHGREGANISIVSGGETVVETDGIYAGTPCIYQAYEPAPNFDGNHPVFGSWMVNGYACGMGIRESQDLITQNTSRFVPHVIL
jgi:glutathionylspermidine synthase